MFVRGISINPSMCCNRAAIICSLTPLRELLCYSRAYNIAISQLELNLTTARDGRYTYPNVLGPPPRWRNKCACKLIDIHQGNRLSMAVIG